MERPSSRYACRAAGKGTRKIERSETNVGKSGRINCRRSGEEGGRKCERDSESVELSWDSYERTMPKFFAIDGKGEQYATHAGGINRRKQVAETASQKLKPT